LFFRVGGAPYSLPHASGKGIHRCQVLVQGYLELLGGRVEVGVAGLREIIVYKEEDLLGEEHLALSTMKGTLLLLTLLVIGELGFQTSESSPHPM